jgi:RelA/SpoT family (p)ppGpp synthetase
MSRSAQAAPAGAKPPSAKQNDAAPNPEADAKAADPAAAVSVQTKPETRAEGASADSVKPPPPQRAPSRSKPVSTGTTAPAEPAEKKPIAKPRGFLRQYELVERVKAYQPDADEDALNRAYVYATLKHGQQTRHSGDPYYAHPVAVAGLLTTLKLDEATIIAGLLHDVVEDTDTPVSEIRALFGDAVAELVDGVTKLPKLESMGPLQKQAENFQKFILATTKDIRVLLVKLADRLHNMRTIDYMPKPESRLRIARETLEIYAPLARRVGLSIYATELEDIAFKVINPTAYEAVSKRISELTDTDDNVLDAMREVIEEVMRERGIEGSVSGRVKRPYSIWRKLESRSISFRDLGDVFAYRLLVDTVDDCYRALGAAHQHWHVLSEKFKDYISVPKPNGYRSLHTTFLGPSNRRVELQIRTAEMDEISERGVAAHWRYKNRMYGFDAEAARAAGLDAEAELTAFADMLAHGAEPEEFLEHAKMQMYRDSVFVFTPKGQLVKLPAGSTPLDFAYALHSEIGDTTVGCRINDTERPLRTVLVNGDVVEILRSDKPAAHPNWESLAVTGRARSAIRRLTRQAERGEYVSIGMRLIEHALQRLELDSSEVNLEEMAERAGFGATNDLAEALARGRLSTGDLLARAFPGRDDPGPLAAGQGAIPARSLIVGEELTPGVSLHLAECCSPLPGDRIVGVLVPDRGVEVHVIDCARLADHESEWDRWIDLKWRSKPGEDPEGLAVGRIKVTTANRRGALALLCRTVAEAQGNIINIKTLKRSPDFFDFEFDIEVEDTRRLTQIVAAMRALAVVDAAERMKG